MTSRRETMNRVQRVVRKCLEGASITDPALRERYAQSKGYQYRDGKFYWMHGDGSLEEKTVTDADLTDFANQENTSKWYSSNKLGDTISALDNLVISASDKVQNQSSLTQGIGYAQNAAAKIFEEAGNTTVSNAIKGAKFANDVTTALGYTTDSGDTIDNIMNAMPVLSVINSLGGSTSQNFSMDNEVVERAGSSYGGVVSSLKEAEDVAGKKSGLFNFGGTSSKNKIINRAKNLEGNLRKVTNEAYDQSRMVAQMGDIASNSYLYGVKGGYKQNAMHVAQGGKLPDSFEPEFVGLPCSIKKIVPGEKKGGVLLREKINPTTGKIEPWKPELVDTEKLQNGGKVWKPELVDTETLKKGGRIEKQLDAPEIEETSQKNIIPEGALHKNKHHIENTEDLTKKGIPVIDDHNVQAAEIEKEEIIFTKEVTTKLEELYKVYYNEDSTKAEKEEAALDAGKLLTKEIMLNTDDRTGIIDKLQQGGPIIQQKPSYEEWLKGVDERWLSDNYDLEKAYELLPFEQLENWRKTTYGQTMDTVPEGTDWHLPSVAQIDENTYIYLKKGQTTKDNPELQGEFDYYASDPNFKQEFEMKFDKDNNRWYYVRRAKQKARE